MSGAPRIVLVMPRFPAQSETFLAAKVAGLLARGLDVHVVCQEEVRSGWEHHKGVLSRDAMASRVHVLPAARPRIAVPFRALAGGARALVRAPGTTLGYLRRRLVAADGGWRRVYRELPIVALRPDIVHFEFGALAPASMGLGHALERPITVSFRGYDICYSQLGNAGFYDPVWQHAARIHVLGEDLWQRALARGCPADMPHTFISPAVDTTRFAQGAREGNDDASSLRLVSVGRLHWKKGHEIGLVALKALHARGVAAHWTIVGDGPQRAAIAFAIEELGLGEHVDLVGTVAPEAVRRQLDAADVFFHPSVSEGFCNAVLEAQAMGLPIVTTDAEGLPENIEHGTTGLVAPRRDPHALADALEALATDPDLRRSMGEAGPRRVAAHFGWDDHLARWEEFYRSVLPSATVP